MKSNINMKHMLILLSVSLSILSCKPDDDDLVSPSFSKNPDVFIDNFSGGLEYAAFGGSVLTAFDVDVDETYNGSAASMKFAVPDVNSPLGSFAGGVFFVQGGRDLSDYNALTFYAKASRSASIDLIGFGNDLGAREFEVSISGVDVNTNWQKYYIPIPDPSKLTSEKGLLYYSEGPEDGEGYTFWIDEVKFENVGLLAHPKPVMMGGENIVKLGYQGVESNIDNVSYSINLPTGIDETYNLTTAYYDLVSSNESVVKIEDGNSINIVGPGLALIRGFVGGTEAEGTLTLNVLGNFESAPTPTFPPENVISLFSDSYTNVPVDYFNGFWEPFQTTRSEDFDINGNNVLNYVDFNFVGTLFSNPTVDATNMTNIQFDVFLPGAIEESTTLSITLRDLGPDGADGGGDDTDLVTVFTNNDLEQGTWNNLTIPLTNLPNRNAVGLIIYEGNDLENMYVDNILFYN